MKQSENTAQSIQEEYGLILHEAGGGGDCLYHSVADQLARNGLVSSQTARPFTYQELRHLAVEHIRNNPEIYSDEQCAAASSQRPAAIGGPLQNREAYLAAHSKDREFGDDLIRSAISRELGVTITTINHASPEPIIQRQEPENAQLYVYYTGGHYQSLIPIRDNLQFHALQAQVITHPVDEMTLDCAKAGIEFVRADLPELPIVQPEISSTPTQGEQDNLAFIQSMPLEDKLANFQASIEYTVSKKLKKADLQKSIEANLQGIISSNPVTISVIAENLTHQILTNNSQKTIEDAVKFVKTLAETNKAAEAHTASAAAAISETNESKLLQSRTTTPRPHSR